MENSNIKVTHDAYRCKFDFSFNFVFIFLLITLQVFLGCEEKKTIEIKTDTIVFKKEGELKIFKNDSLTSNFDTAKAMLVFLKAGGLKGRGINFDAKTQHNSTDLEDIYHAHIGGADTFAHRLLVAGAVFNNSNYEHLLGERYILFSKDERADFVAEKPSLANLHDYAQKKGEPEQIS